MRVRLALLASLLALIWSLTVAPQGHATPICPANSIKVPLGADLHTAISNGQAETYCLAGGLFDLGGTGLSPDDGDSIWGKAVTVGPLGEIIAPTQIQSSDPNGVIQGDNAVTLALTNLDISGAMGGNQTTAGINGWFEHLTNLTLRYSRVHGNGSTGITGVGPGLRALHVEIDGNGSGDGGTDGGIKTVHYAIVDYAYFHNNLGVGMWWDCDAPGGVLSHSILENNAKDGLSVEISLGEVGSHVLPPWGTYGFAVYANTVTGNNTTNTGGHAGILIDNSKHVDVGSDKMGNIMGNTVTGNSNGEVLVKRDDSRDSGHSGCTGGYAPQNHTDTTITVHDTLYGPGTLQYCSPVIPVDCHNNTYQP